MTCMPRCSLRGLLLCRLGQLGRRSLGVFKSQFFGCRWAISSTVGMLVYDFHKDSQVLSSQGEFSLLLVSTSAREIGGMLLKTECLAVAKCDETRKQTEDMYKTSTRRLDETTTRPSREGKQTLLFSPRSIYTRELFRPKYQSARSFPQPKLTTIGLL